MFVKHKKAGFTHPFYERAHDFLFGARACATSIKIKCKRQYSQVGIGDECHELS